MPVIAPPDLKVPYDIDGTIMLVYRDGVVIENMSAGTKAALNDDSLGSYYDSGQNQSPRIVTWQFFQPMTITALWGRLDSAGPVGTPAVRAWGYSLDSTNGLDGTWTYVDGSGSFFNPSSATVATHGLQWQGNQEPNVRSPKVLGAPVASVKALNVAIAGGTVVSTRLFSAAVYGHVTTPAWLEFWHPTIDQAISVAEIDWGFHDRGTVDTQQFRLKNCHGTSTIVGVGLSLSDISTDSPQAGASHTLSLDDTTYLSSITVGDLAPGEISDILYVKRSTPSNAVVGVYDLRIVPTFTGLTG